MANDARDLRLGILLDYLGMALVLLGLILFFGFSTQRFLTLTTFTTIANQVPAAIVVAVGMTYVLIIGGIDLSVGSVLGVSGAVLGVCLVNLSLPWPAAVAACLLTGLACGAVNGLVTVWWGLPSFIVTLAMLEIARGGAGLVTNQRTIYFGDRLEVMRTTIGDLSVSFWIAIAIAVVGQLVLAKTVFGRYMVAIGTNEEVVRLSGIRTWPIKLAVFAISGLLASLAAVMDSARFNSALPEAGTGFELQAIAAVVIGGTSLMGGRGSVLNSVFGVLIMVVLQAGLIQLGVADPIKKLITGAVIVVAVILDRYRHRLESAKL